MQVSESVSWAVSNFTWRRLDHMEDGFLHSVTYKFIKQIIRSSVTFQNWHLRHLWSSDLFYVSQVLYSFVHLHHWSFHCLHVHSYHTSTAGECVKVSTVKFFRGIKLKKKNNFLKHLMRDHVLRKGRIREIMIWHHYLRSNNLLFSVYCSVGCSSDTASAIYLWFILSFFCISVGTVVLWISNTS